MENTNTKVQGYGTDNLVSLLEQAEWTPCFPDGRNFEGIQLAGYCLSKPKNRLCSTKYRVTVTNQEIQKQFAVEGFCFHDTISGLIYHIARTGIWRSIKIVNQQLSKKITKVRTTPYEILVEAITS